MNETKKSAVSKLNIITMLISLFDIKGIIHYGFVLLKQCTKQSTVSFGMCTAMHLLKNYQKYKQQSDFTS